MNWESCLYVGTIEHRRFLPIKHAFSYSVFYYYLDLDEVQRIFKFPFLFSYNFPGLLSFWRKDYLGDKTHSLKEAVNAFIKEQAGEVHTGAIRLMTNVSYFGFCFNPVSFYYCFEDDGVTLKYVVSEITNTPWNERYRQLFKIEGSDKKIHQFPKDFHVSPFIPMAIDYTWLFRNPKETLFVLMQNRERGQKPLFFDSTLEMKKVPLTLWNVFRYFLLFPFVTLKTMLAIYYQAARLKQKKAIFYNHPGKEKAL